jgi:hypothetical protein
VQWHYKFCLSQEVSGSTKVTDVKQTTAALHVLRHSRQSVNSGFRSHKGIVRPDRRTDLTESEEWPTAMPRLILRYTELPHSNSCHSGLPCATLWHGKGQQGRRLGAAEQDNVHTRCILSVATRLNLSSTNGSAEMGRATQTCRNACPCSRVVRVCQGRAGAV